METGGGSGDVQGTKLSTGLAQGTNTGVGSKQVIRVVTEQIAAPALQDFGVDEQVTGTDLHRWNHDDR